MDVFLPSLVSLYRARHSILPGGIFGRDAPPTRYPRTRGQVAPGIEYNGPEQRKEPLGQKWRTIGEQPSVTISNNTAPRPASPKKIWPSGRDSACVASAIWSAAYGPDLTTALFVSSPMRSV